jgi:hypothetical protein
MMDLSIKNCGVAANKIKVKQFSIQNISSADCETITSLKTPQENHIFYVKRSAHKIKGKLDSLNFLLII